MGVRVSNATSKHHKFLTAAKTNDELITVWTIHVKGMTFDLEDIGGTITDEDIIVILTICLGMGYDHFMALIDAMLTQQLTVDYMVTMMLNEEVDPGRKRVLMEMRH